MRTRLLLIFLVALLLLPAVSVVAQQVPPRPDAARNAERIPDHVAIRMFLSSIAIPPDADQRTIAVNESKIARLSLNRSDRAILRAEAASLRTRLTATDDALMASGSGGGPPSRAAAEAAGQARQALVMDSYTRLLETLSPGGRQKLAAHIAKVKTQIKPIEPGRR